MVAFGARRCKVDFAVSVKENMFMISHGPTTNQAI
jgi:hypothetical protein